MNNPTISHINTLVDRQSLRRSAFVAKKLRLPIRLWRRAWLKPGLLIANGMVLLAVGWLVWQRPATKVTSRPSRLDAAANPLDQLSSADIAVHVARLASLPEATAVANQADTVRGQQSVSSADERVLNKPQVVATALKSRRDIKTYQSQPGDSLATVAAKFGVTSDSIKWSNDLSSPNLSAGQQLVIPPVTGIVYVVKPGDTPEKLAREYNTNQESIVSFNDAEVGGLKPGEKIVLPDATKSAPMYVATSVARSSGIVAASSFGSGPIYGYNGYDYGWCTWYVASKISVPANWGNASSWARLAARDGWTVSSTPRPGAIAQNSYMAGGLGHVAVVEAVSEDGSMIKYSDMNGLAGWGRVGYSGWVPANSVFQKFIYR